MNIIKSDLVEAKHDVLWNDISLVIKDAIPAPVLVLVNDSEPNAAAADQVQKMLGACKLAPSQYNIIYQRSDEQIAWHQLRDRLDPKIIFLIGILPSQLGVSALFKLNEPNHFNDRVWLPTISTAELEQYPDIKKQLWTGGMHPIFIAKSFGTF